MWGKKIRACGAFLVCPVKTTDGHTRDGLGLSGILWAGISFLHHSWQFFAQTAYPDTSPNAGVTSASPHRSSWNGWCGVRP
jgi:hypothetical protein